MSLLRPGVIKQHKPNHLLLGGLHTVAFAESIALYFYGGIALYF